MSDFLAGRPRPASVTTWADPVIAPSLALAAESLCVFGGFLVVSVGVVRDDVVQNVAAAGSAAMLSPDDEPRGLADVLEISYPVEIAEHILASAESWGAVRFLDHRREVYRNRWRVDHDYSGTAWHVDNVLVAPVRDENDRLRGVIRFDGPVDGRMPDAESRTQLNRYVEQAARVLLTALEREEYADRVRLADTARQVMVRATGGDPPQVMLDAIADGLVEGFNLMGLRATLFEDGQPTTLAASGTVIQSEDPRLVAMRMRVARYAWEHQTVGIATPDEQIDHPMVEGDHALAQELFERFDLGSVMIIPIGSGEDVYGALSLYRRSGMSAWSLAERAIAQEIGRDLGRVLSISRALELERAAAESLRALDAYKSQLIATVAHELKSPIAVIRANLEEELLTSPDAASHPTLAAIERGTTRATVLIDELLQLAAASDPANFPLDEVDLVAIVRDAVSAAETAAGRVQLNMPDEELVLIGNRPGLQIVVTNLVTNALKYGDDDGVVSIAVHPSSDDVELTVTDHGLGIAPEEQELIFQEFFRSANPQARRRPGTGLGLAIVDRLVQRHHGRISVESELGAGSTFHVVLPRRAS